jgi:hypothetical protein
MSKQKRKPRDKFKPLADVNKPWNFFVIRGSKTKHGPGRERRKLQFVQSELLAIFQADPSKQSNIGAGHKAALVAEVNGRLALNSSYQAKYPNTPVNHMTVKRALRALHAANR